MLRVGLQAAPRAAIPHLFLSVISELAPDLGPPGKGFGETVPASILKPGNIRRAARTHVPRLAFLSTAALSLRTQSCGPLFSILPQGGPLRGAFCKDCTRGGL